MDSGSKDLINSLPDHLLCHILSFLGTKEAASTSLLSRRWRDLLAFVPNLEFDDSVYLHPEKRIKNPLHEMGLFGYCELVNNKRKKLSTSFLDFVDRILALQGNFSVHKFSLKIVDSHDPVDPDSFIPWIHNVLERGVLDLHLVIDLDWWSPLPSTIFLSETLVRLTINGPIIDVKDVHLPKLKFLYLKLVSFREGDIGFSKFLSGCHVLEELVLDCIGSCEWTSGYVSVSVPTLKRLTSLCWYNMEEEQHGEKRNSVSFDTPNLVYLKYTEVIAHKYPKLKFDSLVEAKIDLVMTEKQFEEVMRFRGEAGELEENIIVVGNATDFIKGICNVKILYLSADTLEVLTFCCNATLIFNNLTHLTIKSNPKLGWESLPVLLKNCPKLETLVFQGLLHKATDRCGDVCLCKSCEEEEVRSCLSASPVKVLKILINDEKVEKQTEQVKHFLETMPHLEQLVLCYDSSFDQNLKVSTQLQMLTRVASPKCKVQIIPSNLSVTSTDPFSVSTKWGPLL